MAKKAPAKKAAAKKVGWGIIGSRGWADMFFAPAVKAARGAELRAVLSSKRATASAFCKRHGIERGYTDLKAFLADDGIDAVWVASPNHQHAKESIAALKAGKHVLCEKPMAVMVADARAMIRAADKAGKVLSIGYNSRYHPRLQKLQAEWAAGKYGKPVYCRSHFYFSYPQTPKGWRRNEKQSGSWVLGDVGTHMIDLERWFFGDVKSVTSRLSSPTFKSRTAEHALLSLGFKNGAAGTIDCWITGHGPGGRFEFFGTEGYMILDGIFLGFPGTLTTCLKGKKPRVTQLAPVDAYKLEAQAFTNAVASGKALPLTAQDGLANVQVIAKARGW